jgi:hypothetical protein
VVDLPELLLTSYFTGAARQDELLHESRNRTKPIQAHALENALELQPMTLKSLKMERGRQ